MKSDIAWCRVAPLPCWNKSMSDLLTARVSVAKAVSEIPGGEVVYQKAVLGHSDPVHALFRNALISNVTACDKCRGVKNER